MGKPEAHAADSNNTPIHFKAGGEDGRALAVRRLDENRADESAGLGAVGGDRILEADPERFSGGNIFAIRAGGPCERHH